MLKFKIFWPLNLKDPLISPCNLPKAIKLPENEIEPITPPTNAKITKLN